MRLPGLLCSPFIPLAVLAAIMLLGPSQVALAQPAPPFSPYGTVKLNGANVPLDTQVSGWCAGVMYGSTTEITIYNGDTWYANLDILGDDPGTPQREGCLPGETVSFKVGDHWADQTASWSSTSLRLDLTASSSGPTSTPSPTPTPTATPEPNAVQMTDFRTESTAPIAPSLWPLLLAGVILLTGVGFVLASRQR